MKLKRKRLGVYAIFYKGFGKWNWYGSSFFNKERINNILKEVKISMKSKAKILKAHLVFKG